jgi:hypothetical protein
MKLHFVMQNITFMYTFLNITRSTVNCIWYPGLFWILLTFKLADMIRDTETNF